MTNLLIYVINVKILITIKILRKKVDVNNIISVNFRSYVLNINYSMPCFKNDLFRACIEKLIVEYPILKDKNIYFLLNGIKVD